MNTESEKNEYIIDSLNNALQILDLFGKNEVLGIADISRQTNISKAGVYRILYTLEKRGYLFKMPKAKYRLSMKFAHYGVIVSERLDLVRICRPYLEQLRDKHNEAVLLTRLTEKGEVLYAYRVNSRNEIQLTTGIGSLIEAYCTAGGKAMLSQLDKETQLYFVNSCTYMKFTENTITDPDTLLKELELVRERGYSETNEEGEIDLSSVAVPVFDYTKKCIAAICISGPTFRMKMKKDELIPSLLNTAVEVSMALGYVQS